MFMKNFILAIRPLARQINCNAQSNSAVAEAATNNERKITTHYTIVSRENDSRWEGKLCLRYFSSENNFF